MAPPDQTLCFRQTKTFCAIYKWQPHAKQIDTTKITLTAPAAVGKSGMMIHKVSYANKPLNILLTDEMTCSFQPSAYRGNGSEERLGIVMKASDDMYQVFAGIEARCRGLLHLDIFEKLKELW